VAHAVDGEPLEAGRVYVAPPDLHLVADRDRVHLDPGPTEHMARPSIDRLFRSLAEAHGPRAVGVVLSGMLDDGTAGLQTIRLHGGVAVAQDPADAAFPGMPASAVRHADPDHVLPLAAIGPKLVELATSIARPTGGGDAVARSLGSR
jgi:two-component system, chemotaxis family, protein-glutamate methylesterase/glutaminase